MENCNADYVLWFCCRDSTQRMQHDWADLRLKASRETQSWVTFTRNLDVRGQKGAEDVIAKLEPCP